MNALEQIAVEAFPPQEYVSPQELLAYTEDSDDCDFLGFYAGKDFIGYLHLIRYKNMVYVCFFAVGASYRSRGYGSEILSKLKELYPTYRIVLDIEAADESAPNLHQQYQAARFLFEKWVCTYGALYCILGHDIRDFVWRRGF